MNNLADRRVLALILGWMLVGQQVGVADNWPAWRGPAGDGKSAETDLPTKWSRTENIRWRVAMPEPGNSTPIVWNDKVLLTQAMDGGRRRTVLCLDAATGEKLWQAGVDAVEMERMHETNPYCSPSPVTDGERVIAWFGSSGLVAFDLQGNELWQRDLGKVNHMFGHASSPVLHEDLCILNFGPGEREFAVAVDKHSGEIVWQHEAPKPPGTVPDGEDNFGTWATPIVAGDAVIFCFRDEVAALDPTTGVLLWKCRGLGPQMKSSPFAGDGAVVALGGKDSSTLAVKLGGSGDITESHVLWSYPRAKSRLGAGVIHDGHIYANQRSGLIECIELDSGKPVWRQRHSGSGSTSNTWSSLLLAGGRIYAVNQSADVFVVRASPEYELIATNSLGEYTNSTIVGAHGRLYLRTHESLWCIGE